MKWECPDIRTVAVRGGSQPPPSRLLHTHTTVKLGCGVVLTTFSPTFKLNQIKNTDVLDEILDFYYLTVYNFI